MFVLEDIGKMSWSQHFYIPLLQHDVFIKNFFGQKNMFPVLTPYLGKLTQEFPKTF
jgi:hypothetical protein